MGSITQLNDKFRTVPQQLVSDDQARSAIEELSALGADSELLDVAARKGLLAISVPSDFGGADLPNELIAELIEVIALRSEDAARRVLSHFAALELVRTSGTAEQRRGIYSRVLIGERLAHVGFSVADTVSEADGIGLRLDLPVGIVPALHQDWTILPILDDRSRRAVAVISAASIDQAKNGTGLHLPGDHVLPLGPDAEPIARAIDVLLEAALNLGLLSRASTQAEDPQSAEHQSVLIELLSAMITRVAAAIDGLQVGSATVDLSTLNRSVIALQDLNRQASGG